MRAHGLRGEVVVDMISDRPERVASGAVLTRPRGIWWSPRHGAPGALAGALRGLSTGARTPMHLRDCVLWATPIDDDHGALGARAHRLSGASISDGVERGVVESVQDNPAADLLVLDRTGRWCRWCSSRDAPG